MESEARDLILYVLDADRRRHSPDEILAGVRRRLSVILQSQRERDAEIAHNRATEWDRLQESDTTGMAKPRYLEACDIAALIRDPSLA